MFTFKEIELSDKAWIDPLLHLSDFRGAEYCFTNLFAWKDVFKTRISRWNNFLLIRSYPEGVPVDVFPSGEGNVKKLIDKFLNESFQEGRDFRMEAVDREQSRMLQRFYPGFFEVSPSREIWDYIYRVEDLSLLQGKRYQPKRNHIAHFENLPDWRYEPITAQNVAECIEMNRIWGNQMGRNNDEMFHLEVCVAESELRLMEELCLEGALLRVSGRVVAYTLGEPLNSDTYIIHIEKAFPDVRGAYQMINREFIRDKGASFTFVNREEDLNEEGLRKAKNSYHPTFLQEKYYFVVPYKSLSLRR